MARTSAQEESRFELATALLLGLAALLTAWAAFQASLFDGDQADGYAAANLFASASNASFDEGDRKFLEDQALFLVYIDATREGRNGIANYVRSSLISARLETALALWKEMPKAARRGTPLTQEFGYEVDSFLDGRGEAARSATRLAGCTGRRGERGSLQPCLGPPRRRALRTRHLDHLPRS